MNVAATWNQRNGGRLGQWLWSWVAMTVMHGAILATTIAWRSPVPIPQGSGPVLAVDLLVPSPRPADVEAPRQAESMPVALAPISKPEPSPRRASMRREPNLSAHSKPVLPIETKPEVLPVHEAVAPPPPPPTEPPTTPAAALSDASAIAPARATAPPAAVTNWRGAMLAHLERYKRYPSAARLRQQQGVSTIYFVMDRNGRVVSMRLERSAGHVTLDQESLELIERAQPLPLPPMEMIGDRVEISVPIEFALR